MIASTCGTSTTLSATHDCIRHIVRPPAAKNSSRAHFIAAPVRSCQYSPVSPSRAIELTTYHWPRDGYLALQSAEARVRMGLRARAALKAAAGNVRFGKSAHVRARRWREREGAVSPIEADTGRLSGTRSSGVRLAFESDDVRARFALRTSARPIGPKRRRGASRRPVALGDETRQ